MAASMRPIYIQKNVKVITAQEEECLAKYFSDIQKEDLITKEQEIELSRLAHLGDKKAFDKLVKANLRFVISVAKQYQHKGVFLADLINEGNIGLIKAIHDFDETRGIRLISFAVWYIRQAILSCLTAHSRMIYIPNNQSYLASKIQKVILQAKQKDENHTLSYAEIADILHVDINAIENAIDSATKITLSFSQEMGNSSENLTLEDVTPSNIESPDAQSERESLMIRLMHFLSCKLDDKELQIVVLFFGIDQDRSYCLQEIAAKLGVTKECVRQMKEKALRKLRFLEDERLKNILLSLI